MAARYGTDSSLSEDSYDANRHAKHTKRSRFNRRRRHDSDEESSSSSSYDSANEIRKHLLQELSLRTTAAGAAEKNHPSRSRRNDDKRDAGATLLGTKGKLKSAARLMDEIQRALDESSDPGERRRLAKDISKLRNRIDDLQDRIEEGLVDVPTTKETVVSSPSASSPSSATASNNDRLEEALREINKNLRHSKKTRSQQRSHDDEFDSAASGDDDDGRGLDSLERKLKQFQAQRELKKLREEQKRRNNEEMLLTRFKNEQLKREAAEKEKAEKEKQREEHFRQRFIAEQRRAEEEKRQREEEMRQLEAEVRDKITREKLAEELREKERRDHEQRLREQWEHERRKEESREQQKREDHEHMMKRAQEAWLAEQSAQRHRERRKEEDEARKAEQRAREVLINAGYPSQEADKFMKKGSQSAMHVASSDGNTVTKYRVHKSFVEPQVIAELGLKVENDARDPMYWQIKAPLSEETQNEMFRRSEAIQMAQAARLSNQGPSPVRIAPQTRQRESPKPKPYNPHFVGAGDDQYFQVRNSQRRPPAWYNAI